MYEDKIHFNAKDFENASYSIKKKIFMKMNYDKLDTAFSQSAINILFTAVAYNSLFLLVLIYCKHLKAYPDLNDILVSYRYS